MANPFHYPPEIIILLTDTIPLLCRSKKEVILFLQGAGVESADLAEMASLVQRNPSSVNKFEIVRDVITKLNLRGDSGLRARREIIKRVVEFENFESCWESDQYKAKGLVATIREEINKKDSFTRMKLERDAERADRVARQQAERNAVAIKRTKLEDITRRLYSLFPMNDKPQERGKLLEGVLNDLFRAYGIHVLEDFRRKDPETGIVVEQIDGVIELEGTLHLVEMKWLSSAVGIGDFSPHISRLFIRNNANGIFIAVNGYASSVISECRGVLNLKTIFLCSLHEIVLLLQRQGDLTDLLKRKQQAAIVDKNPFLEILS